MSSAPTSVPFGFTATTIEAVLARPEHLTQLAGVVLGMFFQKWPTRPPAPAYTALLTATAPRNTMPSGAKATVAPRRGCRHPSEVFGGAVVTVDLQAAISLLLHDGDHEVIEVAGRLGTAERVVVELAPALLE